MIEKKRERERNQAWEKVEKSESERAKKERERNSEKELARGTAKERKKESK